MRVIYYLPDRAGSFSSNELDVPKPESIVMCGLKEYEIGTVATFGHITNNGGGIITEAVCYLRTKV